MTEKKPIINKDYFNMTEKHIINTDYCKMTEKHIINKNYFNIHDINNWYLRSYYYHWVYASTDGLFVPEDIIRRVVRQCFHNDMGY
jgi:hypothetical protein